MSTCRNVISDIGISQDIYCLIEFCNWLIPPMLIVRSNYVAKVSRVVDRSIVCFISIISDRSLKIINFLFDVIIF